MRLISFIDRSTVGRNSEAYCAGSRKHRRNAASPYCALQASWAHCLTRVQQRRRVLNGLDDLHVAGAAADVAAERLANLGLGRPGVSAQEPRGGHDEAGRAVAALGAELLVEAAL